MSITINELKMYLGTGLKAIFYEFGSPEQIIGTYEIPARYHLEGMSEWMACRYPSNNLISSLSRIKPVFRPLSDLTKTIKHEGEEVTIFDVIYNDSWMAGGYILETDENGYHILSKEDNSTLNIDPRKPQVAMQWVFETLVKYHFDVFGLIEQGKAISVHDLKENPYEK